MPARLQVIQFLVQIYDSELYRGFNHSGETSSTKDISFTQRDCSGMVLGDLYKLRGLFLAPLQPVAGSFSCNSQRPLDGVGHKVAFSSGSGCGSRRISCCVGKTYFLPKPRNRFQFSTFLRFLTSDVFLGTLHLPRDDWYDSVLSYLWG